MSKGKQQESFGDYVVRIRPLHFIHVLDTNTNILKVVCGPKKLTCLEHEKVVYGPEKMVIIPPRHYVIVDNPVVMDKVIENKKEVLAPRKEKNGQVVLRHGDQEIRFEQDPFPLYPGEKLNGQIKKLQVVEEKTALHLRCKRDFTDKFAQPDQFGEINNERKAGDEWLFRGPGTFYPQIEVDIINTVRAVVLNQNQALRLRARNKCFDKVNGRMRKAGEEWNIIMTGVYLPDVLEEVVAVLEATILTHTRSIHVKALKSFVDRKNIDRKAGDQWLVTREDCELYIPDVAEEIIDHHVPLQVMNNRQFCVINDPHDEEGKQQLGFKKQVIGPSTFFLKPGESIYGGIQGKHVLSTEQALWVTANSSLVDERGKRRKPGDKWAIYGPGEYVPQTEVSITKYSYAILKFEPLGIYIFSPSILFGILILIISFFFKGFFFRS